MTGAPDHIAPHNWTLWYPRHRYRSTGATRATRAPSSLDTIRLDCRTHRCPLSPSGPLCAIARTPRLGRGPSKGELESWPCRSAALRARAVVLAV